MFSNVAATFDGSPWDAIQISPAMCKCKCFGVGFLIWPVWLKIRQWCFVTLDTHLGASFLNSLNFLRRARFSERHAILDSEVDQIQVHSKYYVENRYAFCTLVCCSYVLAYNLGIQLLLERSKMFDTFW